MSGTRGGIFFWRMRGTILNILAFLGGAVPLSLLSLWQSGPPGPDFSLQTSLLLLFGGLGEGFSRARREMEQGIFPACAKKPCPGRGW